MAKTYLQCASKEDFRAYFAACGAKAKGHRGRTLTHQEAVRIRALRQEKKVTK